MNSDTLVKTPRHHLVGWVGLLSNLSCEDIEPQLQLGLNSFVGDYGPTKVTKTMNNFLMTRGSRG